MNEGVSDEVTRASTKDPDICRFCLEPEDINNVLLKACKCKGSVAYVHSSCLVKWFKLRPNPESTLSCCLCKTEYIYGISRELEELPSDYSNMYNFFTSPILYFGLTHYFFVFGHIFDVEKVYSFYRVYIYGVHLFYFYLLNTYVPIKNTNDYMELLITQKRIVFIIVYFTYLLSTYYLYYITGAIITLGLYRVYEQHISILTQLNDEIEISFFPYEEKKENDEPLSENEEVVSD